MEYTNEQIKAEVQEVLSNPQLRRCSQCIHGASLTRCDKLNIPISRYQYCGHCIYYMTNEEKLLKEAEEAVARKDRENKKDDRVLTMSFISVEMAIVFLEHFVARFTAEYNAALKRIETKSKTLKRALTEDDKEYLKDKKKEYKRFKDYADSLEGAMKKMDFHLKEARKQYVHLIEPKLNKAFLDEEHTTFNADEYDNHGEDVLEIAMVAMKYFDATYMNASNGRIVMNLLDTLPAERIMSNEDYRRYNLKR
jgi:hypothetical protein